MEQLQLERLVRILSDFINLGSGRIVFIFHSGEDERKLLATYWIWELPPLQLKYWISLSATYKESLDTNPFWFRLLSFLLEH